jgi:hypothetical protein
MTSEEHHENMMFIHIIANQEPNLHDELLHEFRSLKGQIEYISTWIEDFHNTEVFEDDAEKIAMLNTFKKIRQIMEDEIQ